MHVFVCVPLFLSVFAFLDKKYFTFFLNSVYAVSSDADTRLNSSIVVCRLFHLSTCTCQFVLS